MPGEAFECSGVTSSGGTPPRGRPVCAQSYTDLAQLAPALGKPLRTVASNRRRTRSAREAEELASRRPTAPTWNCIHHRSALAGFDRAATTSRAPHRRGPLHGCNVRCAPDPDRRTGRDLVRSGVPARPGRRLGARARGPSVHAFGLRQPLARARQPDGLTRVGVSHRATALPRPPLPALPAVRRAGSALFRWSRAPPIPDGLEDPAGGVSGDDRDHHHRGRHVPTEGAPGCPSRWHRPARRSVIHARLGDSERARLAPAPPPPKNHKQQNAVPPEGGPHLLRVGTTFGRAPRPTNRRSLCFSCST